jgi:ferrous iron transport protein A
MSDSPGNAFRLTMALERATVRIVALRANAGVARRIATMGLNVGCELTVLQRVEQGLVVARGETRLALGTGIAHSILVSEPNTPESKS